MSIIAYTGRPGSGKSYNAVMNVIVPALAKGRRVVTNIPIDAGKLQAEGYTPLFTQLVNDDLVAESFITECVSQNHGAVFVLDETWRMWPAGMQQSKMPPGHAAWLAEHRHHTGSDGKTDEIVIVTQDLSQICAPVRALIETTYIHRKLSNMGRSKNFKVQVFMGAQTGTGRETQLINALVGKFSPKTFAWYQSHTHSETGAGLEEAADERGNIFRSPKMLALMAFAVVAPLGGIWLVSSAFADLAGAEEELAGQETTVLDAGPPPVVSVTERSEVAEPLEPPPASGPVASSTWRVTGFARFEGRTLAFLESLSGQTKRAWGCDLDYPGRSVECVLDGELVRSDTGRGSARRAGVLEESLRGWSDRNIAQTK